MERIYYSRQNYNQLKRKQYEEYIKRQSKYYLYKRKQYEEYIKRQTRYYLYKKKQYEEYIKRQNNYYLYKIKQYEEYIKRKNSANLYKRKYDEEEYKRNNDIIANKGKDKDIYTSQSEFSNPFKIGNIEDNDMDRNSIKENIPSYLGINIEESNLEHKKYDLDQYNYLENESYTNIENSHNEEFIEERNEKFLEENDEELIEKNDEEFIEESDEEFIEESDEELIEESDEELIEESDEELIEESDEELVEESNEEFIEESNEEFIEENDEELIEKSNEEFIEENDEEFIEKNEEEFIEEDYDTFVEEEVSKKNNISTIGLYVNAPVILAETNVEVTVEDTIMLDQKVKEIKRIKKNVFLTQSLLIPFSSSIVEPNSGILFITGFIRKNIEYSTQICTEIGDSNVCGNIKYCTVEVPFNFTTRITFIRTPIFIENTTRSEFEFITDRTGVCGISSDSIIGCDLFEQSFIFNEVFNEKPFVELVKATFIEVDINKNPILSYETTTEKEFTKVTEKIIINLTLNVLQKQQLKVEIE